MQLHIPDSVIVCRALKFNKCSKHLNQLNLYGTKKIKFELNRSVKES